MSARVPMLQKASHLRPPVARTVVGCGPIGGVVAMARDSASAANKSEADCSAKRWPALETGRRRSCSSRIRREGRLVMGRLIVRHERLMWSVMLTASFVGFAVTQAGAQTDQAPTGAYLFRTYCASCHGVNALGDGPLATAMRRKPANLTEILKRHDGVFPSDKVFRHHRRSNESPRSRWERHAGLGRRLQPLPGWRRSGFGESANRRAGGVPRNHPAPSGRLARPMTSAIGYRRADGR